MLLWGLGGLAALYFLTRPKTAPQQAATQRRSAEAATTTYSKASSVARVGLPYTYNAEI